MKILINATALVARGCYSIIKDFLEQINSNIEYLSAKDILITVLVAKEELVQYSNSRVKVVFQPYPKKGLLQRLHFEGFLLHRILKEEGAHAYLSMQNTSFYKGNVPQYVLIQQSLHFSGLGFWEFELGNLVKYGILMDLFTRLTIKNYQGIIVQTNWVKEAVAAKYGFKQRIRVIRPELKCILNANNPLPKEVEAKLNTVGTQHIKLLYVTSKEKYKNNTLLIDAIKAYNRCGSNKKVVLLLTLDGMDEDGVKYLGKVPYESISNLYRSVDALIFPSLCETLGLPLMEAMRTDTPIIAANLPYANEVCKDNCIYFEPRSRDSIIAAIDKFIRHKQGSGLEGSSSISCDNKVEEGSSYIEYIDYICSSLEKR